MLAQEEARLLNHTFIGTEHILLGLIREGDGLAAQALGALKVSLEAAREKVEETIGMAGTPPSGSPPFTPRAKKVLELSLREAMQRNDSYIGTEHLLLGLVREGEGVAANILVSLGADLGSVRQKVIELMSGGHRPHDSGPVNVLRVAAARASSPRGMGTTCLGSSLRRHRSGSARGQRTRAGERCRRGRHRPSRGLSERLHDQPVHASGSAESWGHDEDAPSTRPKPCSTRQGSVRRRESGRKRTWHWRHARSRHGRTWSPHPSLHERGKSWWSTKWLAGLGLGISATSRRTPHDLRCPGGCRLGRIEFHR